MPNFIEDLNYGLNAKDKAYNLLIKNGYVLKDLRDDKTARAKGIDFLMTGYNNIENYNTTFFVKSDSYADKTGNMVYEIESYGSKGCMEKTQADILVYVTKKHTYLITIEKLRKYIEKKNPPLRKMGENSKGYFIRIALLLQDKIAREIKDETKYEQFEDDEVFAQINEGAFI